MRKLVHSTYTVRTVKRGGIMFTVFSVKTTYTYTACHLASYTAHIMATLIPYSSVDPLEQNGLRRLQEFERHFACYRHVQPMVRTTATTDSPYVLSDTSQRSCGTAKPGAPIPLSAQSLAAA